METDYWVDNFLKYSSVPGISFNGLSGLDTAVLLS